MKKSKLYVVVAILTSIFLFSLAALCNQCGVIPEEGKEGIEEAKSEEVAEEETEESIEEEAATEETEGEETEEEVGEEEEAEEGEKAAPTIELKIYEGPTYSEADNVCFYRIEAIVAGNPNPSVEFSKDDSLGAFGSKKAQVNLHDPSDTYTLTATATNSEGTATDSIDLSWGCEEPEPEPEVDETSIAASEGISGMVWRNGVLEGGPWINIGDSNLNTQVKGYLSFDISGLHGKTVQDAEINFTSIESWGNPESFASALIVKVYNYIRLDTSDFAVGGEYLASIPISATSYAIGGNTLKSELQNVLDNEIRDYFQLKLGLNAATNNDGIPDGITIYCNEAVLYISYTD